MHCCIDFLFNIQSWTGRMLHAAHSCIHSFYFIWIYFFLLFFLCFFFFSLIASFHISFLFDLPWQYPVFFFVFSFIPFQSTYRNYNFYERKNEKEECRKDSKLYSVVVVSSQQYFSNSLKLNVLCYQTSHQHKPSQLMMEKSDDAVDGPSHL